MHGVIAYQRKIAYIVLLAFIITITFFSLNTANAKSVMMKDIQGHWAEPTIQKMADAGIVSGNPDGTFNPEGKITRAEFATLLVKAYKLSGSGKVFTDTTSHWAKDYIAIASANGIVNGYSDSIFGPNDPITREQMAVMIVKTAQLEPSSTPLSFTDSARVSAWASTAVATAFANKIIKGLPDGRFAPQDNATRAQAAVVINASLNAKVTPPVVVVPEQDDSLIDKAGSYGPATGSQTINGNVTVKTKDVTLQNLLIKGDLIIAKEVGDGDVILNNIRVEGKTYIRGGGKDSIHIKGGQYSEIIVEKTATGHVRVLAVDVQGIKVTVAENAAGEEIILDGQFTNVTVKADGVKLSTQGNTEIGAIKVQSGLKDVNVELVKDTLVKEMILDSKTTIKGEGTIKEISGSKVNDSTYTTQPDKISTPKTGSGGGGGSSSVAVTGVSLDKETMTLIVGGASGTLAAAIVPVNASNKAITWASSNAAVVTVANGVVTPKAAGIVTIIVTTVDGNKTATAVVTVNAAPEVESYTVNYDGNGNTGGTVPIDNKAYKTGDSVTILGNIGSLNKDDNFTYFSGWNTKADGTGIAYAAGSTFDMETTNITLYAQWTELPAVNATFNPVIGIFDKKKEVQADVATKITWGSATRVTAVKNGEATLTAENYIVAENTLTIKKEYLATQAVGEVALSIEFDRGNAAILTITVSDTTPSTYAVTFSVIGGNGVLAAKVDDVNINSGDAVAAGKSVVFIATPADGYQVKAWKEDSKVQVAQTGNTFTLSNLQSAKAVTVEFEATALIPVKVTVETTRYSTQFKVKLSPALTGLTKDNIILRFGETPITINDLNGTGGSEYWVITGSLERKQAYTLTIAREGYNFGNPVALVIPGAGEVRGVVLDDRNNPLAEVDVSIWGGPGFGREVKTDDSGNYSIKDVIEGTYTNLDFIKSGYKKKTIKNVIVENGGIVIVETQQLAPATYTITIAEVIGGIAKISIDKSEAAEENELVTVWIDNIEAGKQFKSITVTDADSGAVATTQVYEGKQYKFTMPAKAVTITVGLEAVQS